MSRMRSCALLMLLVVAACGGSGSTPTQPTGLPADLSPASTSATVSTTATANVYVVSIAVREVGGQSAATLRPVQLRFMRGADVVMESSVSDAWPTQRIAAGATLAARPMTITDERPARPLADRVTVTVAHVTDTANSGSVTFSVPVTAAAP